VTNLCLCCQIIFIGRYTWIDIKCWIRGRYFIGGSFIYLNKNNKSFFIYFYIKHIISFENFTISRAQSCNLAGLSCKWRFSWIKHGVVCILHLYNSHKVEMTSDRVLSSFDKSSLRMARDFFFVCCNSLAEERSLSSEL